MHSSCSNTWGVSAVSLDRTRRLAIDVAADSLNIISTSALGNFCTKLEFHFAEVITLRPRLIGNLGPLRKKEWSDFHHYNTYIYLREMTPGRKSQRSRPLVIGQCFQN